MGLYTAIIKPWPSNPAKPGKTPGKNGWHVFCLAIASPDKKGEAGALSQRPAIVLRLETVWGGLRRAEVMPPTN
jgi:hypothetical protein